MGQAAGFDMTTPEGMNAFMLAYEAQLARQSLSRPSMPIPTRPSISISSFFGPSGRPDPAARKAEKKKRKQAEAARKRNRKQRK